MKTTSNSKTNLNLETKFSGKVAFVSGGGSGIGELLAKVIQDYQAAKSIETSEIDDNEELGRYLEQVFHQSSRASKKSRVISRCGDIQHVDHRFRDFTEVS